MLRCRFAKDMMKKYSPDIWSNGIMFYLDGKSFEYKRNPLASIKSPRTRVWRTAHEGLAKGCTARASKCGTGSRKVHMIVCISHGKGVCEIEQYEKMNGDYFASFVTRCFPRLIRENFKNDEKLWLQDGDPSQNCKSAREAWEALGATLLKIPPRSPDLNPIENIFHLATRELNKETVDKKISRETFDEFSSRVKRTLRNIPVDIINKTIDSVSKRLPKILASGGTRLKY